MDFEFIEGDLPEEIKEIYLNSKYLSIDTETKGLNLQRDKLCLVQMCNEDGKTILLKIVSKNTPNLKTVLENGGNVKIFHFARFDVAILKKHLDINVKNVYCTKIASKLVRTYTDKHGLKNLVSEFLEIEMDKSSQSTDWASDNLSQKQLEYAAHDVIFLVKLKEKLDYMLEREGRSQIAHECFSFLPTLVNLELNGWDEGVFRH